mmetsp:Transcript_48527/g.150186  ORF Transcript_48527/g.150186 Transcript_48527/m.150186 type:complete len:206 (-) Transcript_48527:413-1030(-)
MRRLRRRQLQPTGTMQALRTSPRAWAPPPPHWIRQRGGRHAPRAAVLPRPRAEGSTRRAGRRLLRAAGARGLRTELQGRLAPRTGRRRGRRPDRVAAPRSPRARGPGRQREIVEPRSLRAAGLKEPTGPCPLRLTGLRRLLPRPRAAGSPRSAPWMKPWISWASYGLASPSRASRTDSGAFRTNSRTERCVGIRTRCPSSRTSRT